VRPGEHESASPLGDLDSGAPFFGLGEDPLDEPEHHTRAERHRRARSQRRARRGWFVVGIIAIVAVAVVVVVTQISGGTDASDYTGTGTSAVVQISIPSGATAADIGKILQSSGVVASTQAFTNAASQNSNALDIQPGYYDLHAHMSAKSAIAALLDPASRDAGHDVLVPEGATVLDVEARLVKVLGASQKASIDQILQHAGDIGLPVNYGSLTGSPEGFLYPATYTFDPGTTGEQALQQMVQRYISQDRQTGFASAAKAVHLTPYQALIIASIEQAEAKFPADMPKVARVILNRIAANMPLQIDATSAYAAKLKGQDPAKVIYSQIDSPYNSYTHDGLPPTPIGNPGSEAMNAAVHPATGNWLYYVNGDKAGHLFFTNSPEQFQTAVDKCRQNNWGCG
jgi:UPF0755 protein